MQPVSTTGARTIAKAEASSAGTRSTTIRSVLGVPSYQVTACSRESVNEWAHSPAIWKAGCRCTSDLDSPTILPSAVDREALVGFHEDAYRKHLL